MKAKTRNVVGTIILICALLAPLSSNAQMQAPGAAQSAPSMTLFPVERGRDGKQYIVTRAGYRVIIPGLGIAPNAGQIAAFRDNQNNYWYIDRNNQAVQLTAEQIQWTVNQINAQAQQAQQANMQQQSMQEPPADNNQSENSSHKRDGKLVNTVTTAAGAFAGAAVGTAVSNNNSYHGIPYGTPCYRQGNQYYYHGANGNRVNLAQNANNAPYMNQWNSQNSWEDARDNRKDKREGLNQNQKVARYNAATVRKQNNQQSGGRGAGRDRGRGR